MRNHTQHIFMKITILCKTKNQKSGLVSFLPTSLANFLEGSWILMSASEFPPAWFRTSYSLRRTPFYVHERMRAKNAND